MNHWKVYLTENKPIKIDSATAVLVGRCIRYSKNKQQCLVFASVNNYPVLILNILIYLPASFYKSIAETDYSFEAIMTIFKGDFIQMLDHYTSNGLDFDDIDYSPTIEQYVDICIKEGGELSSAIKCAKKNSFPEEVVEILNRLPKSIFENITKAEVTFVELMDDYDGDLENMIIEYLTETDDDDDDDDDGDGKEDSDSSDAESEEAGEDDSSGKISVSSYDEIEQVNINPNTLIDMCIKNGKTKEGALEYAVRYGLPSVVYSSINIIPDILIEFINESDHSFSELIEPYNNNLENMVADLLPDLQK